MGIQLALAIGLVAILPARGADALADIRANPLHGQRQQDLFPEDVLRFQPAAFIKPDLGFALVDRDLFVAGDDRGGLVEQVEPGIQSESRAAETAVALRGHIDRIAALDAHFAVGVLE